MLQDSRRRHQNCLRTKQPSFGPSAIMTQVGGCHMTASSGGRRWLERTSIGQSQAFTGRARAIPRCTFCLQDDHTGQYCPKNPDRAWLSWPLEWAPWSAPAGAVHVGAQPSLSNPRQGPLAELHVCRRYNEGRCRQPRCRYTHACRDCAGPHPAITCPSASRQAYIPARSRSPPRLANPPSQLGPTPVLTAGKKTVGAFTQLHKQGHS